MATRKKATGKQATSKQTQPARRQPESLRLRAAAPTLTVNDIQRSLDFYERILRFTVKDRWERDGRLVGAELVAGAVTITLTQDDFSKGRDRVKGVGQRLWTTTAQDIDALAEGIRGRGGNLDEGPVDTAWGARILTVTDPDGFKLSIARE